MIYDLSDKLDRQRFSTYAHKLFNDKVKVELKKKREKRTLSQNSYLHLIMTWFGFELGYTVDEVKQDIFKREICKDIFMIEKNGRSVCRSTADLNTLEMTQAIEKFRNYSSKDLGIYLPSPNEQEQLNSIDDNLKKYGTREFL